MSNPWSDYEMGRQGMKSPFVSRDNIQGLQDHAREKESKQRYNDAWDDVIASYLPKSSGQVSYPATTGDPGGVALLLAILGGGIFYTLWAFPYAMRIANGNENWAWVVMGLGLVLGYVIVRLLWMLFLFTLGAIGFGIAMAWQTVIGKAVILASLVIGGFYGSDIFFGKEGVKVFLEFLLIVSSLGVAYAFLKWFVSTRIGKFVTSTLMVGGILVASLYLYIRFFG